MNLTKCALFIIALLGCGLNLKAQQNLPYSRYGIGTLSEPDPASLKGWGDLTAPSHNPSAINLGNPASYSALKITTFEAGIFGSLITIGDKDSSQTFGDGSVSNFALGFPVIRNKLGICLGITPFSRVNYNIIQKNDSVPGLGQTGNSFQGSGGLYRFFLGSGIKYKNLAAGLNIAWVFGTDNYTDILVFEDTVNALSTKKVEQRVLGGFLLDAGLQYRVPLQNGFSFDLGLQGNFKTNISSRRNLVYQRLHYSLLSGEQIIDTVFNSPDSSGKTTLPASFSGGVIFRNENHFSVGVNYRFTAWDQYRFFEQKDITINNWNLSIGTEWIPNYKAYNNYLNIISYRTGLRYGKDYIQFNQKDLPQYGVSVGLGLPLKRTISQISLSGQWLHTGHTSDNPVSINTYRLTLGLTLNDVWFLKRRFD
ncbi:MAG: hypothetical protein H0W62_14625 [Chitinophagales bacterium]|nr:hypothetical protein [Chitinophagales bacterium]